MGNKKVLIVCTTDSMIWNFLIPHIIELKNNGYYIECACSRTGFYFQELVEKYGIIVNELCFKRTPYSLKNIKAFIALKKIIKSNGFDIVFCHEPVGGALGRIAGHSCGCKVIYMAHGFHFYNGAPSSKRIYFFVEKYLSKYTDVLITINQEDYQASLKFQSKKNVLLHGIGVDISKFSTKFQNVSLVKQDLHIGSDSLIFLSVGELIHRKNHEMVIKAFANFKNKKIVYLIAGQGELMSHLSNLVKSLNLQNQVLLLGFRRDINILCSLADVFVFPSIHEGLSVALMEAMACGKPVICSKIRGNIDLIDNEKGGLCVPNSIDDYVNAIKLFIDNKDLIEKFGNYNIQKVKKFDISIVKQELLEVFENL